MWNVYVAGAFWWAVSLRVRMALHYVVCHQLSLSVLDWLGMYSAGDASREGSRICGHSPELKAHITWPACPDLPECPPPPIFSVPLLAPMFVCCTLSVSDKHTDGASARPIPRVRLVAVANDAKRQATKETVKPHILPTLGLGLLAGLHAKQPACWWVVVIVAGGFVAGADVARAGAADRCGGEKSWLRARSGSVGYDLESDSRGCDQARRA